MAASRIAKCVVFALLMCQTFVINAQGTCPTPTSALILPPGAEVIDEFQVVGTQNYTCSASTGTYTLLGIEAQMLQNDKVVGFGISGPINGQGIGGIYFKTDPATNETVGSIAAVREDTTAATLNSTAIPWFIRKATAATGTYAGADYIWRHVTNGGVLPEGEKNCTAEKSEVKKVPYTATYTVYKCGGSAAAPSSASAVVRVSALAVVAGAAFMALSF